MAPENEVTPSWRKPVGVLGIVSYIVFWTVLVASFSGTIGRLPVLIQLPIYIALGIVWIFPLRPALRWMETGRLRAPSDPAA